MQYIRYRLLRDQAGIYPVVEEGVVTLKHSEDYDLAVQKVIDAKELWPCECHSNPIGGGDILELDLSALFAYYTFTRTGKTVVASKPKYEPKK